MSALKSKFEDAEWLAFVKEYYQRMWDLAVDCVPAWEASSEDSRYIVATFEKLASPAVYLDQEFDKWKRNKIPLSDAQETAKSLIGVKPAGVT